MSSRYTDNVVAKMYAREPRQLGFEKLSYADLFGYRSFGS